MIIHPEKNDIPEIKQIWKECFEDTDECINQYFDNCFKADECYVSKEGDTVQACLQMVPCTVFENNKKHCAKYLYAVCTKPELQGKGIMTVLLNNACEAEKANGTSAILCVPSGEGLFGYYKRFGFTDAVYCSSFSIDRNEAKKLALPCEYSVNADAGVFNKKRNELLSGNCFVSFPDKFTCLADGSFYSTAFGDNFFCIFYQDDGITKVSDCCFKNGQGKRELFYFLVNETNSEMYEIDYCADFNSELKGVIKYLGDEKIQGHIYIGMKME